MLLSDASEEFIFKKTMETIEDMSRIGKEVNNVTNAETAVAIHQTLQMAMLTIALLRISKELSGIRGVIARKT